MLTDIELWFIRFRLQLLFYISIRWFQIFPFNGSKRDHISFFINSDCLLERLSHSFLWLFILSHWAQTKQSLFLVFFCAEFFIQNFLYCTFESFLNFGSPKLFFVEYDCPMNWSSLFVKISLSVNYFFSIFPADIWITVFKKKFLTLFIVITIHFSKFTKLFEFYRFLSKLTIRIAQIWAPLKIFLISYPNVVRGNSKCDCANCKRIRI